MKNPKKDNAVSALLLINKPAGWTSHDAIAILRKALSIKRIGHSGTLDPMATGLLIALIGRATKYQEQFQKMSKVYSGTITFGTETDTWDSEGKIVCTSPLPENIDANKIKKAATAMKGCINQIIPLYSAAKYKGIPMHRLARKGKKIPLKKKKVIIYKWSNLIWKKPNLSFIVECSSGTYVRSIAHELGKTIGCGASLKSLKRLKIKDFDLKNAINAEKIKKSNRQTLMLHTLSI
jgi:tRNA pseudouridine55 synthase